MNTKGIRRLAFWSAVFLVVALLVGAFLPVPPHGRFGTPQIGSKADAYLEAVEGKLTQVVFDGEQGREGAEHRQFIGDYRKEHGRRILVTPDGSTGELRIRSPFGPSPSANSFRGSSAQVWAMAVTALGARARHLRKLRREQA